MFNKDLDMAFLSLRTSQPDFYTVSSGKLTPKTLPTKFHELATSSYLGVRQTLVYYDGIAKMKFTPSRL